MSVANVRRSTIAFALRMPWQPSRRKARCFFEQKAWQRLHRYSNRVHVDIQSQQWDGSTNGSTSFRFIGFLRSPLALSSVRSSSLHVPLPTEARPLYSLRLPCACHVAGLRLRGINPKIKSGLNTKFQGRDAALRGLACMHRTPWPLAMQIMQASGRQLSFCDSRSSLTAHHEPSDAIKIQ